MNARSVSSIKQRFLFLMIHGQGFCAQKHNLSFFSARIVSAHKQWHMQQQRNMINNQNKLQ